MKLTAHDIVAYDRYQRAEDRHMLPRPGGDGGRLQEVRYRLRFHLARLLRGPGSDVKGYEYSVGHIASLPSGQETTENKVQQAIYFMSLARTRSDMVMNRGISEKWFS